MSTAESREPAPVSSVRALIVILGVSVAILGFLFWLIYFREEAAHTPEWVVYLPGINSLLNSLSAISLVIGVIMIRRQRKRAHIVCMATALFFSALFLVSYITYHHYAGNTPFPKDLPIRPYYLFILFSHILLSGAIVPLILLTVWFALTGRYERHRKVARWTWPIWLYVSVTGVVVYFMLRYYVH
jgi:putative membrane protein